MDSVSFSVEHWPGNQRYYGRTPYARDRADETLLGVADVHRPRINSPNGLFTGRSAERTGPRPRRPMPQTDLETNTNVWAIDAGIRRDRLRQLTLEEWTWTGQR